MHCILCFVSVYCIVCNVNYAFGFTVKYAVCYTICYAVGYAIENSVGNAVGYAIDYHIHFGMNYLDIGYFISLYCIGYIISYSIEAFFYEIIFWQCVYFELLFGYVIC